VLRGAARTGLRAVWGLVGIFFWGVLPGGDQGIFLGGAQRRSKEFLVGRV